MPSHQNQPARIVRSANDYDIELYGAIVSLVLDNKLEENSEAYEIAMLVVHYEYSTLSPSQQEVYAAQVEALLQDSASVLEPRNIDRL